MKAILGIVTALGFVVILGCGGKSFPKTAPVHGQILLNGRPLDKAEVMFHPLATASKDAVPSTAITGADGSFQLATFIAGDGAPPGEYAVTIVWPQIDIREGEEWRGADRLRNRYQNPQQSKIKVTVVEGDNALAPIELSQY